jgi:hypothetical protein
VGVADGGRPGMAGKDPDEPNSAGDLGGDPVYAMARTMVGRRQTEVWLVISISISIGLGRCLPPRLWTQTAQDHKGVAGQHLL